MTETIEQILTDDAYEQALLNDPQNAAKPKWAQKRIDQLTAEKHAAKAKLAELEQALEQAIKPEELESRARTLAAQRDFEARCNNVHAMGLEAFPEFDQYVDTIGQNGGLSPVVVDAIITSPHAVHIISVLGQNPSVVADLHAMPPHLQIAQLIRLERKIKLEAQSPLTDAPAPIQALKGIASDTTLPSDGDDMKTWIAKRKAQLKS